MTVLSYSSLQHSFHKRLQGLLGSGRSQIVVQDPGIGLTTVATMFETQHPRRCRLIRLQPTLTVLKQLDALRPTFPQPRPQATPIQTELALSCTEQDLLLIFDNAEMLDKPDMLAKFIVSVEACHPGNKLAILLVAHAPFPLRPHLGKRAQRGDTGLLCPRMSSRFGLPIELRYDGVSDIDLTGSDNRDEAHLEIGRFLKRMVRGAGLPASLMNISRARRLLERNPSLTRYAPQDVIACLDGSLALSTLLSRPTYEAE